MNEYQVNSTPVLTWTWLKLNNDKVNLPEDFCEQTAQSNNIPEGFSIESGKECSKIIPLAKSSVFNSLPKKEKDHRKVDGTFYSEDEYNQISTTKEEEHPFNVQIDKISKNQQYICITGNPREPLILNIDEQNKNNLISKQIIHAKANSESTVIFVYNSDGSNQDKTQIVQTKFYADENAKLHIIKIQLTGNKTIHLDDFSGICEDDAKVSFTQIELGGLHIDSGINVSLKGNRSSFISKVAYLCKDKQYLDMNHLVCQYGKRTSCSMDVDGTLKDEAVKVYRGTLDLKKGCAGSKGNELENTLLLSPKAINKSMPNILCTEEDIAAQHGSTIGRLSNEVLFYMQTRGICPEEAERIISITKIKKVLALVPDEAIQKKVCEFLGENEE